MVWTKPSALLSRAGASPGVPSWQTTSSASSFLIALTRTRTYLSFVTVATQEPSQTLTPASGLGAEQCPCLAVLTARPPKMSAAECSRTACCMPLQTCRRRGYGAIQLRPYTTGCCR
eukprot:4229639-Amphidinium_carterae.1